MLFSKAHDDDYLLSICYHNSGGGEGWNSTYITVYQDLFRLPRSLDTFLLYNDFQVLLKVDCDNSLVEVVKILEAFMEQIQNK